MVVENLKVFTVKSYKELFKMYKKEKLGITEQRMPENLQPLKPSKKLSELECIQSLLETDYDFPYHVYFDGEKYIISILGFSISKVIDGTKQLITFGEDGIWQEEADYTGVLTGENDESDLEWQDSSSGTLEMWGMYDATKHEKEKLHKHLKGKTFEIKEGKLEEFRDLIDSLGYSPLMGYDETYKEDDKASSGFVHYDGRFYISKNDFFKDKYSFEYILNLYK